MLQLIKHRLRSSATGCAFSKAFSVLLGGAEGPPVWHREQLVVFLGESMKIVTDGNETPGGSGGEASVVKEC